MWRLKRPIHSSWLIAMSCMAIFLGVVLAAVIQISFIATLGWLLTGLLLCLYGWMRQMLWCIPLVIVGGLIIGLWRGSTVQQDLDVYQETIGTSVLLRGVVAEDKDTDSKGNTTLRMRDVSVDGQPYVGQVWVSTNSDRSIERSDVVYLSGLLSEGFGTFAARMYRADVTKVERPEPGDVALHVRDWFAGLVRQAIPDPESALGIGYLVGQRRSLPPELDTALKVAGLTHIVVASGYNLTILVRLARRLFVKISKYVALVGSFGLIASFIAITGMSPSMSRAGLIAGLSLLAWYYGRSFHPLVLLPVAIATTVLVNPSYAWGDVGWQLSFAAFAGVMILAPLLQRFYFGEKKPGTLRQILGETISATIATLPILLFYFGYMSNVGIFANLLILPLVPLAMLLTFVAGIGAFVFAPLAPITGFPAYALLTYMTSTAEYFANLDWATSEITINDWHVLTLYVGLASFMGYMYYKTKPNLAEVNIVE